MAREANHGEVEQAMATLYDTLGVPMHATDDARDLYSGPGLVPVGARHESGQRVRCITPARKELKGGHAWFRASFSRGSQNRVGVAPPHCSG